MSELMQGVNHPWIKNVYKDVHDGDSPNILLVGKRRTGKSFSTLRLGEILQYPDFKWTNIVFSVDQFIKLLQSGNLKDGDVVGIDDAGVGVASRRWNEERNKRFSEIAQTYGYKHLIVIYNTIGTKYMDTHIRSLFDWQLETVMKNEKAGWVKLKVRLCQYNPDTDKIYRKIPTYNGKKYPFIYLKTPSKENYVPYQKASEKWKDQLSIKATQRLEEDEAKEKKQEKFDTHAAVQEILKDKKRFMKEWRGKSIVNLQAIQAKFGIGFNTAKVVKSEVEMQL